MISSILFVVLFLLCLSGVVWLPKTEKKINGVKALVMGTMAILCYLSLGAFFLSKIGITLSLNTASLCLAAADVLLWGTIGKKHRVQRVFFRVTDVLALILLAWFVIAVSLHMFTPKLRLSYINSDPANHFNKAMVIVQRGTISSSIYFSAFVDALVIWLLSPLLSLAQYYKAFIAADILMHILEIWMFYVLVQTISDKKIVRVFAPLFALGYFYGYPLYSYATGGFVYWSTGVMILILMVYALILFERHLKLRKYTAALLFLAAYANSCCNALFIPVNYAALFAALLVIGQPSKKKKINKKAAGIFVVAAAAALVAVAALFLEKWDGSFAAVIAYVSKPGAMYHSMYADLVFFIPPLIYVVYESLFRKKYTKIYSVMALVMLCCTCVMYAFVANNQMSFYYYYKIYYNLWLFGWILAAAALDILAERRQLEVFASYAGMIALLAVLTFQNYDMNMWKFDPHYNADFVPKHMFALYWHNMDTLQKDYAEYTISPKMLDVMSYATEQLSDEKIPALVDSDRIFYWFDGMRAQNTRKYKPYEKELMDILVRMDKKGITKILVDKEDRIYHQYQNYFELCKPVYENDQAAILTFPGKNWCSILSAAEDYDKEKLALYSYVKKELKGERVPLMASKDACVDYVIYRKRTKQKSTDCYSWMFSSKENLDNLNALGIRYVLLLSGDAFYEQNQHYFDSQETVFETAAGKVVRCNGDAWTTSYPQ